MAANVLIVDDSSTMRRVIRRTLEISGLEVGEIYEASNGIEALARMDEHVVHVILLDVNMPVMGGVKLVERMQQDARFKEIPVVIASSEGSETRIAELIRKGARAYVRKPFQPEQIRDILAPLLGQRSVAASPGADETTF
jgi:two-component system chemotaxis response regulator CheY